MRSYSRGGPVQALALALGALVLASASAGARVETTTRFLELDQKSGILAYELTVRNLGSLPVDAVRLECEPASLEGPLSVTVLAKEEQANRRFTFRMPEQKLIFQPRFKLTYTDNEGERHVRESEQSPLVLGVDFGAVDVARGLVTLKLDLLNTGQESLLFVELWSENPGLPVGKLAIGDLAPGTTRQQLVDFSLPPGELLFNPTLHVSFHAFEAEGTQFHRKFYTIVQSRLDRVEAALAERAAH